MRVDRQHRHNQCSHHAPRPVFRPALSILVTAEEDERSVGVAALHVSALRETAIAKHWCFERSAVGSRLGPNPGRHGSGPKARPAIQRTVDAELYRQRDLIKRFFSQSKHF